MSREWVTVPVERPEIVSDFLRGGLGGVRVANADIVAIGAYIERLEALAAAPQPAQAPDRMDELRRSVAEIIGCDPETWPEHGNAPLAIAAIVALGEKARERLYGKGQHGGSYRKPDGSLWKVITETELERKP